MHSASNRLLINIVCQRRDRVSGSRYAAQRDVGTYNDFSLRGGVSSEADSSPPAAETVPPFRTILVTPPWLPPPMPAASLPPTAVMSPELIVMFPAVIASVPPMPAPQFPPTAWRLPVPLITTEPSSEIWRPALSPACAEGVRSGNCQIYAGCIFDTKVSLSIFRSS